MRITKELIISRANVLIKKTKIVQHLYCEELLIKYKDFSEFKYIDIENIKTYINEATPIDHDYVFIEILNSSELIKSEIKLRITYLKSIKYDMELINKFFIHINNCLKQNKSWTIKRINFTYRTINRFKFYT